MMIGVAESIVRRRMLDPEDALELVQNNFSVSRI
jgi:hypothetical protein